MPTRLRSFAAVLAGYIVMALAVIVATLGLMMTLHQQTGYPTSVYVLLNLFFSAAGAIVGGLVTAFIAGKKPLQHGYILAAVIFVMSVISFRTGHALQPRWYQAILGILMPLFAIVGAWLQTRLRSPSRP